MSKAEAQSRADAVAGAIQTVLDQFDAVLEIRSDRLVVVTRYPMPVAGFGHGYTDAELELA